MKNKLLIPLLILALCLGLSACGDKGKDSTNSDSAAASSTSASSDSSKDSSSSSDGSSDFKDPGGKDGVVEIKEKMFLTQITDIFANFDDYKDKKVKVEGMFTYFKDSNDQPTLPVVYRKGPGCCGNDGWGGFFLDMPKDMKVPNDNDWIIVTGSPEREYDDQGVVTLHLKVDKLEVSDKRGAEFVKQ